MQFFLISPQSGLCVLSRGDVLDLSDAIAYLAGGIGNRGGCQRYPNDVPLFVNVTLLYVIETQLSGEHFLGIRKVSLKIVRMSQRLKGCIQKFLLGVSQDLAKGLIYPYPATVVTHQRHSGSRIIEHASKSLFAFLGYFAFGDVYRHAQHPFGLPVRCIVEGSLSSDPTYTPI